MPITKNFLKQVQERVLKLTLANQVYVGMDILFSTKIKEKKYGMMYHSDSMLVASHACSILWMLRLGCHDLVG